LILEIIRDKGCLWNFRRLITGKEELKKEQESKIKNDLHDWK